MHRGSTANCELKSLCIRKIIKIIATRCYILRLKCTKFDFGCSFAPDPTGGADSASLSPLKPPSWILGVLILRKERREKEKRKGEER